MGDDKTMPERIWADRSDDGLPQYADTPFGIWWHGHRDGYTEYVHANLINDMRLACVSRLEAAVEAGVKAGLEAAAGVAYTHAYLHGLDEGASRCLKEIRTLDPAEIAARAKGGE